ncbi:ABC transporter ATP-binding protein [Acanthopleuribacter pedis]|uniref:ABC transporter ATP-binding protein n=1 Tax=Acanthopleuribacter pedis TaxID=442870 RepID=A0A8J7Q3R7_9BACT|nr:ABC transporter ATP-binding protein [Acanthopleuribacter pedis]MBO1318720.1 ABC transporter ATP-binding protein [Acanthopleuribacter pedis]
MNKTMTGETPESGIISNRGLVERFWAIAKPEHPVYLFSFFMMALTSMTDLARPLVLKWGLDQIEAENIAALQSAAWLFLVVVLLDYGSRSGFSYLISVSFLRTINRLRSKVFEHVIHMKMAFFDRRPVGALMTRTINDCESLAETLRAGIATILVDAVSVLVYLGVLISLDWHLSTTLLVAAPLVWLVVRWCGHRLRLKYLDVRKALAESNGWMAEGIGGVEILQLFSQESQSAGTYKTINRKYRHATITSNFYDALLYSFIEAIAGLVTAAVLIVGFNMRFGLLEISTMIVYLDVVNRLFTPIRELSNKYATIQQALAALQRIFELVETKDTIQQGEEKLQERRLDVAFDKVSFRYGSDGPLVLKNISFALKPGQVFALVGQTGSGKSTIGKLLTRAYDGYEGHVLVGGKELKQLDVHSLRGHIAVVHQDVELFPGSLRENISMFDPTIDDEKVMWAIRLVKAEHLVARLNGGLDYQVREDGGNLSSGQMQLIVFARALAHDAPIVLMDEATASVDSVTEAWIQEAIQQIFKHKTVLIVAHRLSTIAAADQILVLKSGEIIEQGTHEELQTLPGGYYAELVESSKLNKKDSSVFV